MALENREPKKVFAFRQRIKFDTAGFDTHIFIGTLPKNSSPLSFRIIRLVEFTVGAYVNLGLSTAGSSAEWTGYVYLADSGSKPGESTKMVVTGTTPKIFDCFQWEDITVPLGADRSIYLHGGTVGGTITAGDLIVEVLYQE